MSQSSRPAKRPACAPASELLQEQRVKRTVRIEQLVFVESDCERDLHDPKGNHRANAKTN